MGTPRSVASQAEPDTLLSAQAPWCTVVWDDPVNLMSYVTYVFQTYFGMSKKRAHKLMLEVHNDGRAVVSSGTQEKMELDAQAMHTYGLWATIERTGV